MSGSVAVLFARSDSVYRSLGVEVFDLARDARTFDFSMPVVAHPPCRAWGRLRHLAKPRADEKALGLFAVEAVRRCGGVLEHPACSGLWEAVGVRPGVRDEFGGLLVVVDQVAWGHRATKRTGLYCVRTAITPRIGGVPQTTVDRMCTAERERTPYELARDLVEAARAVA